MMKKEKYILIMLSLFICAYLFSNRMTPRIENIASKEINQFIQILINHTSFTQKIDTHKLYKKENNSISFQMNYINDIASNYIHNLEETLLKLEEGSYQENNQGCSYIFFPLRKVPNTGISSPSERIKSGREV